MTQILPERIVFLVHFQLLGARFLGGPAERPTNTDDGLQSDSQQVRPLAHLLIEVGLSLLLILMQGGGGPVGRILTLL